MVGGGAAVVGGAVTWGEVTGAGAVAGAGAPPPTYAAPDDELEEVDRAAPEAPGAVVLSEPPGVVVETDPRPLDKSPSAARSAAILAEASAIACFSGAEEVFAEVPDTAPPAAQVSDAALTPLAATAAASIGRRRRRV